MLLLALVVLPLVAGLTAFWLRPHFWRRLLLVGTALAHAGITLAAWLLRPEPLLKGWLELDTTGLLFLSITSVLFLAAAVYCVGYLAKEAEIKHHGDVTEGFLYANEPEAVFTGCLLLFLAAMTLVTVTQHFGLIWVAVEATTLASAPLIYFHKHHRSLEATWKYLLICSVGIALALLGNFSLAAAAAAGGEHIPLNLDALVAGAGKLHPLSLKVAFLFFLVGYGTKMGLAPLHTWLPDAHSESPSLVSALLSGALLNCAFLAILRVYRVCSAAGQEVFVQELLVGFGLLSMAVAAVFIVGQTDFKRMLAYSSVEHMGILALGVGLGGTGVFGALLHAINHSLTKASLFLVAGNILAAYRTKNVGRVSGLRRALPVSGMLWIAGFLAITGTPPFGPFLSEFTILKTALDQGRWLVAAGFLAILALVFIGMATIVLRMVQGVPPTPEERGRLGSQHDIPVYGQPEPLWATVPPALLSGAVLVLGIIVPPVLSSVLQEAANALGGK